MEFASARIFAELGYNRPPDRPCYDVMKMSEFDMYSRVSTIYRQTDWVSAVITTIPLLCRLQRIYSMAMIMDIGAALVVFVVQRLWSIGARWTNLIMGRS